MKNFTNLLETIRKYGKEIAGPVATNARGVQYRYDTVQCIFEYSPKWLISLYWKAFSEIYGTTDISKAKNNGCSDFRVIKVDNISIGCNFGSNKSDAHGRMSIHTLVIL